MTEPNPFSTASLYELREQVHRFGCEVVTNEFIEQVGRDRERARKEIAALETAIRAKSPWHYRRQVFPMLPTWPRVRCDECRHIYEIPDTGEQFRIVTGKCPKCGHGTFSTTMKTGPHDT